MMPMMGMGEVWGSMGSVVVTIMVLWATFDKYCPYEFRGYFKKYATKLRNLVYPYIHITFHEFSSEGFEGSKAYRAIERYLSVNSSAQAKRLKAEDIKDSQTLVLSMDYHEEVADEFRGIKLWWVSGMDVPNRQTISFNGRGGDEAKKYFTLKFHKKYRDVVTGAYLKHVLEEGKAITVKDRQRKLYTNLKNEEGYYGHRRSMWTHVVFEHPATFETLAMDPKKKQEIIDDLLAFSKSKDYYAKIGKAWKRGYLLYGPPGTGKSSMVAAMANFLGYDVYDLELTAVKDNTTLRKLLIDTSGKSIIVIEDIDCSLDLTGQREGNKKEKSGEEKLDPLKKEMERKMEERKSEVTLSGLLNFIDGLWSAIGGERLIVFTTNFKEKLDPALIRRGRMDKHIELSYCGFEAFKVLAKNYLGIETHELFPTVGRLLTDTDMTPADVAENLMPKAAEDDETTCLEKLVEALEKAKEDARLKAEEDEEEKRKAAALAAEENEEKNSEETMAAANGVKENGHVSIKDD
nr:AAA-ATPase ASD, mitochondrial-like [Ipomoea batatas]GME16670.1 AAA-ATPase ASD, mitochondrial-like [Ipomoea batatas]